MDGYKKPELLEGVTNMDVRIEEKSSLEVDKETLQRIEDIQNLPPSDREALLLTIDNFIKATKLKAIQ